MKNINYKIIIYITLAILVLVGGYVTQNSSIFSKQKAESSSFSGYKMPNKNSQTSSLPTSTEWHEPNFMEKKK